MLLCNKYYANQHHHRPSTPMPFDDLLCFKIMSLNKQIKFNTMNSLLHCIKFDQCENYFSSLHGIFDFIVLLCSISFCAPLVPSLIRCGSLPCMLVHFFFFFTPVMKEKKQRPCLSIPLTLHFKRILNGTRSTIIEKSK